MGIRQKWFHVLGTASVVGLILALLTNCGGGKSTATPQTKTVKSGQGSELAVPGTTKVDPASDRAKLKVEDIDQSQIGATYPPLPPGKKVLAVVNLKPNNVTFTPSAILKFKLPKWYQPGTLLEMMHLPDGATNWDPIADATVLSSGTVAEGRISSTSLYAVTEVVEQIPAAPTPLEELVTRLGDVIEVSAYQAFAVYFPSDVSQEALDALEAYLRENGFQGPRILYKAVPRDEAVDGDDAVNYMLQTIRESQGEASAILMIDQSDETVEILFQAAMKAREEMQMGHLDFVRMDTLADDVGLIGAIP
jgi:hypothetical protein